MIIKISSKIALSVAALLLTTACSKQEHSKEKAIIGSDDRISVDAGSEKWMPVGRLSYEGSTGHCSGALVGRDLVLTAAHCVYDEHGNAYSSMTFSPVYQLGNQFFEAAVIDHRVGRIDYQSDYAKDWAILKLDRMLGDDAGWYMIDEGAIDSNDLPMQVDVAGYSGDILDGDILSAHLGCKIETIYKDASANGVLQNNCDTNPGASGAPTTYERFDGTVAIGVVSHSWLDENGIRRNAHAPLDGVTKAMNDLAN